MILTHDQTNNILYDTKHSSSRYESISGQQESQNVDIACNQNWQQQETEIRRKTGGQKYCLPRYMPKKPSFENVFTAQSILNK